jgi:hypothetical protein
MAGEAAIYEHIVGDRVRGWTETIADALFVLLAAVLVCFLVAISVRSACCGEAAPSPPAAVGPPAAPLGVRRTGRRSRACRADTAASPPGRQVPNL